MGGMKTQGRRKMEWESRGRGEGEKEGRRTQDAGRKEEAENQINHPASSTCRCLKYVDQKNG